MGYNSSDTFVFPCVSRNGDVDSLSAKLMSEENITNLIKSITDNHSYIIDYKSNELEFILDGYYFKLSNFTLDQANPQYAVLYYKPTVAGALKLIEGDDSTSFAGLDIVNDISTINAPYLQISENGSICESSKIKFSQKSLSISTIDCGELN